VENSRITVTASELQIAAGKSYALYFRDPKLGEVVCEVFGRPLKIQINTSDEAGPTPPPASPATLTEDDITQRALSNPEVRRFQEAFPGSKVYKVRNLKE
jgi:hypothetical protein